MSIETLAKQSREHAHTSLAALEASQLRKMRNAGLRDVFSNFNESSHRLEFVARIYGKDFINDASARSINATLYALESTEGSIIWIADTSNADTDYSPLRAVALRKVRMLLCVGANTDKLHKAFEGMIPVIEDVSSLGGALYRALYSDIERAKVLYSPAVDNGQSSEFLGSIFRNEVNEL